MSALQIENLRVAYGPVVAVDDLTLTVPAGRCASVLGVNGAGKSSFAAAVAGWTRPTGGRVVVNGTDLAGRSAQQSVLEGIALVPERRQLFSPLSVEQNLTLGGYRRTRSQRAASMGLVLEMFPALSGRLSDRAGDLSGGQQQMLAIARALMSEPRILILDEPSLGLAPLVVRELSELLRQVMTAGTALVIVEQNSRLALELSDEVIILTQGRVAAQGPCEELLADDSDLLGIFLGH